MSKRSRDEDLSWLDEDERPPTPQTPIEQLERLAAHAKSDTVRIQALKVLLERKGDVATDDQATLELARYVRSLSPTELDAALEGYFYEPSRDAMEAMVAERAARMAEETTEWQKVDRMIKERAAALAERMYLSRGIDAAQQAANAPQGSAEASEPAAPPVGTQTRQLASGRMPTEAELPPGLTMADLQRGFRPIGE